MGTVAHHPCPVGLYSINHWVISILENPSFLRHYSYICVFLNISVHPIQSFFSVGEIDLNLSINPCSTNHSDPNFPRCSQNSQAFFSEYPEKSSQIHRHPPEFSHSAHLGNHFSNGSPGLVGKRQGDVLGVRPLRLRGNHGNCSGFQGNIIYKSIIYKLNIIYIPMKHIYFH